MKDKNANGGQDGAYKAQAVDSFTFICTGCGDERTDDLDAFAAHTDCPSCGKSDAFRGKDWKDFCKEKVELLRSLLQSR